MFKITHAVGKIRLIQNEVPRSTLCSPPPRTVHHVTCNCMHNISLFSFTSSFVCVEVWLKVHEINGLISSIFRCLFDMQYELLLFAGSDLLLPLSFLTRVLFLGLATTFFGPNNFFLFCFELFSLLCFKFKNERTFKFMSKCQKWNFSLALSVCNVKGSYYPKSLTPLAFVWSDIIVYRVHLERYQLELTLFWFGSYWSHVPLI